MLIPASQVRLRTTFTKWAFLTAILASMSLPTFTSAQNRFASPPKTEPPEPERGHEIDGKAIVNTPNRNSSSSIHNIPHMYIPRNELVALGQPCEVDSDCGNFGICLLKVFEPEVRIKACQCDKDEMIKSNGSCYIKPGSQCYFPNKNSHGYSFIQCYPGSVCKSAVNKTAPANGYCMCSSPSLDSHFREVNSEYEMRRCGAAIFTLFLGPVGSIIFSIGTNLFHVAMKKNVFL